MPIYDYECRTHGAFELARPMSESGESGQCPECGASAARIITAPRLRTLAPIMRSSLERNEKSRHAPHVCGSGCSHHGGPAKPKAQTGQKPKLVSYRGPRPWVVEHA